jgi:hypothetical protein
MPQSKNSRWEWQDGAKTLATERTREPSANRKGQSRSSEMQSQNGSDHCSHLNLPAYGSATLAILVSRTSMNAPQRDNHGDQPGLN